DVAVGLGLHLDIVDRGVSMEVVDDLLPRPALRVKPGVRDEPDRAQHLVLQPAEVAVRVLVEADLFPEPLGVEAPALDERRVDFLLAHRREGPRLVGDRGLPGWAQICPLVSTRFVASTCWP